MERLSSISDRSKFINSSANALTKRIPRASNKRKKYIRHGSWQMSSVHRAIKGIICYQRGNIPSRTYKTITDMDTNEKGLFFEYCVGVLAVAYGRHLMVVEDDVPEMDLSIVLKNETHVSESLDRFNDDNDFSRLKTLGLFYRLMSKSSIVLSKQDIGVNHAVSAFHFTKIYSTKNLESDLVEYLDTTAQNIDPIWIAGNCASIPNKRTAIDLVMLRERFARKRALVIAQRIVLDWLSTAEHKKDLQRKEWEFYAGRPEELNWLTYEIY